MTKKSNPYIQVFDTCSAFLKKLSPEDLLKLENGTSIIHFELIDKKSRQVKIDKPVVLIDDAIEILNKSESREDVITYLNSSNMPRPIMEEILKKLDYPFSKKDNLEKLKQKIAEATIGYRLRSNAIQGK